MKIKAMKHFNPSKVKFDVKNTFLDLDDKPEKLQNFFKQQNTNPFEVFVHEALWDEVCSKEACLEFEFEIEVHLLLRKLLEHWRSENMFGSKDYLKSFCFLDSFKILKGSFGTILDEVQTPSVLVNPRKKEISSECEELFVNGCLYLYAQNLQHEKEHHKIFGTERFVYTVHVEISPNPQKNVDTKLK